MSERRERLAFVAALIVLWAFFFVQAVHTPTLLDDWYQIAWRREHGLDLGSLWQYASYNYVHYNPRIGDVILLILNGPRAIHLLATPLVEIGLLFLAYAVAFARWPRATVRDLQRLLLLQVLIWVIVPIPGVIYFYRPYATNYLWGFAITLSVIASYRLALAREPRRDRWFRVPAVAVLGWLAGMSNEHTAPVAVVATAALVVYASRLRRLQTWMIAGLVGVAVGCAMLLFAPGQSVRYASSASRTSPLHLLCHRGLRDYWHIVASFGSHVARGALVVIIAVVAARLRASRPLPSLRTGACLFGGALLIVVTLFASPVVGDRLFFAPGVLVACALVLLVESALDDRWIRSILVAAALVVFADYTYELVTVYASGYAENQQRISLLEKGMTSVPPYRHHNATRWWFGDDFKYASLREYVAHEVYGLDGIDLTSRMPWAEPTPPERFAATRVYDPPLDSAADARIASSYTPSFWEWAVVQLRRGLAYGALDVPGHRLVRYTIDATTTPFVDPQHRALRMLEWTPDHLAVIDGKPDVDASGRAFIRIEPATIPAEVSEAYVVGCGRTERVEPTNALPVPADCAGTTTGYLCDASTCWLAGRFWR